MSPIVVIAGIYSQPTTDDSLLGPEHEYVVLINTGDEPVDMRGWSLTNLKPDRQDHCRYLFPRFLSNGDPWELDAGGMILLYSGRGTNGCTATPGEAHQYHFYQHRSISIWRETGELACLYDRAGNLVTWWELPGVRRTA